MAVRQLWYPSKEYSEWSVQYSSANKPSAADIGAFPSSGGKITGVIHADNCIMGKELWEKDPNTGKEERAYTPFNKPSASDIGAIPNNQLAFLGNGGKFQDCLSSGFYRVGIENITTVTDAPSELYSYGILEVQNSSGVISQRYVSHTGQIAIRQSWDNGVEWEGWNMVYSSTFKPSAADVGAFPITGGKLNGAIKASGIVGCQGDERQHFAFFDDDGQARAWIYKDKGGDGLRISNGYDGGGDWIFAKNGELTCPGAVNSYARNTIRHSGYGSIKFLHQDTKNFILLETTQDGKAIYFVQRNNDDKNQWVLRFPQKDGTVATLDDSYNKSESDNRFIRLNNNTKTSGYILSKAANLYDDPSSRDLGRSGFLRPNEGLEKLGALAIHVAHPLVDGPQHARGISFDYGYKTGPFGISTYAFDEDGNFKGSKRILTEEDVHSLTNIPVGVPLPWSHVNPPEGYFECNGQQFNTSQYPKLAMAYPSGAVPDLRGEFIRAWDSGRGVDNGRGLLSYQSPTLIRTAILDYVGNDSHGVHAAAIGIPFDNADFTTQTQPDTAKAPNNQSIPGGNADSGIPGTVSTAALGSSTVASWWFSTRPRNIAFLYIVRAA
ncbi:phage tail protein [Xenorhabdus sp. PB61.4]